MLRSATMVIDGIVVEPMDDNGGPAMVRVERFHRGDWRVSTILVAGTTNCDVLLPTAGERVRLVLWGGPLLYYMPVTKDYGLIDRIIGRAGHYRLGVDEAAPEPR